MKTFLTKYINLTDEEYDSFISLSNIKHFKAKENVHPAGRPMKKIFFITNGLLRGYRLIDGIDITHYFFQEDWFATDYESFLTENSSEIYIEALIKTTVYEFDKISLFNFCDQHNKFNKIRALLAEYAYLQIVERLKDFQTTDLKTRYHNLVSRNPKLFRLVPQKHIASYLGVAPQSLSRIKKNE